MLHRNIGWGTPDEPGPCPLRGWNKKRGRGFMTGMNTDLDVLAFATRLVDELGETAVRISRVRLVELTAANHIRAAAFWRDVMRTSERLLAEQTGHGRPPPLAGTWSGAVHTARPIP